MRRNNLAKKKNVGGSTSDNGGIPEGWEEKTLGEISADIAYGYTASAKDIPLGPKFLRITDIQDDYVEWSKVPYCEISDQDKLKYKLEEGDICVARTGASTGTNYTIKDDVEAVFASYLIRYKIDRKIADPFYVGHILRSRLWKEHVKSIIGGSAQPGANAKQFADFEFLMPPIAEQRAIVKVLSDLDAKIDLNRRMNETLEATARAIFKQSMELEKGETVTLGDILDLHYGKALKDDLREPGKIPVYGSNGQVGWHNERLVDGPGIVVGRKGNPGIVTWVPCDFFPIDTTFYVVPKNGIKSIYYLHLLLSNIDLTSLGADSAVPGLNRNMAYGTEIRISSGEMIEKLDAQVRPLYDQRYQSEAESRTLEQIRDTLLPKLMSGEIRVKVA